MIDNVVQLFSDRRKNVLEEITVPLILESDLKTNLKHKIDLLQVIIDKSNNQFTKQIEELPQELLDFIGVNYMQATYETLLEDSTIFK